MTDGLSRHVIIATRIGMGRQDGQLRGIETEEDRGECVMEGVYVCTLCMCVGKSLPARCDPAMSCSSWDRGRRVWRWKLEFVVVVVFFHRAESETAGPFIVVVCCCRCVDWDGEVCM